MAKVLLLHVLCQSRWICCRITHEFLFSMQNWYMDRKQKFAAMEFENTCIIILRNITNVSVFIFGAISIAIAFASKELGGSLAQVSLHKSPAWNRRIKRQWLVTRFFRAAFCSHFVTRLSDIGHAAGQSFRTNLWCLPRRSSAAVCAREGEGCWRVCSAMLLRMTEAFSTSSHAVDKLLVSIWVSFH